MEIGHPALRVLRSARVLHFCPNVKTVIFGLKEEKNHFYISLQYSIRQLQFSYTSFWSREECTWKLNVYLQPTEKDFQQVLGVSMDSAPHLLSTQHLKVPRNTLLVRL